MNKKIILWGCGERAKRYIEYGYFKNCDIVAIVDTYHKGEIFEGFGVHGVENVKELTDQSDFLIIASSYFSEIYNTCIEMDLPRNKVIFTDVIHEKLFEKDLEIVKELSLQLYEDMLLNQYKLIKLNERDYFDSNRLVGIGKYSKIEYMNDYFRYRTFEYIADEILESGLIGEVAELGVFRGTFSCLINEKFKESKLFLFDTFEGFDKREGEQEIALNRCNKIFLDYHTETSEELLLSQLPFSNNCVICKGLFPDSITEESINTTYKFVSIDVDFENSIFAGIEFFYPRLVEGGVIFLHDYNTASLHGVKKAVKRYEEVNKLLLKKIPLADRAGTLVIIK
ncbi:TylF/MycF/NovP-related O-methyltransferase [Lacrimispora xylanolytica]|uniref:Macrocin-O-methyltransferase TylF n=1 Tax=Lacrimispora xylanolytica TaxID=29375 RepID=A0ABY7AF07_9FIRM|nr:TylF/MycF/NovP-related O-methyltransferase [Lacrimispora xylanolytica]WAJ24096.1 hypothetical protein OW255_00795 [Lacrimispora xylanolytica]